MKKSFILLSILAAAISFGSCNKIEGIQIGNDTEETLLPQTEVFFQGQKLSYEGQVLAVGTNAKAKVKIMDTAGGLAWPKHTDEGWESARFSIRADGTIPDFYDKSSALYYGRPAGKSGVTSRNIGKVSSDFMYSHYNDRDYDYYKVDTKTGNNIGLFRYVYDIKGLETQPAILEAPSVVEILADEKDDLEAAIAAGKNVAKNTANLEKVNELLAKGAEYLDSHVLWYVVKEVASQYRWHVNGVIRDVETPEYVIDPIPSDVEVDVHQQQHTDWFEIKTSIHVRADVESVKVNLPLKEEDILEADDFNVRIFDYDFESYQIKHTITHNANGITIEISGIPASLIEQLRAEKGDGITIEVHSYCKKDVWEDLKNSRVKTGKPCNVNGQIHTALQPDVEKPIAVENN
ncbi:MAG: hypothetical protein J5524_00260 [Bacteroidaceae bacterium]|nr:hypothetical protein [Bacteroidaceae bacterium]